MEVYRVFNEAPSHKYCVGQMNGFVLINGLTLWKQQILYNTGEYESQQHKTTQIIQKEKKKVNHGHGKISSLHYWHALLVFVCMRYEKAVQKSTGAIFTF